MVIALLQRALHFRKIYEKNSKVNRKEKFFTKKFVHCTPRETKIFRESLEDAL